MNFDPNYKVCSRCGEQKPRDYDHYYSQTKNKDSEKRGYSAACIECSKKLKEHRRAKLSTQCHDYSKTFDKKCTRCNITKPNTSFYKNRCQTDGYDVWCKSCKLAAVINNRQKHIDVRNKITRTCEHCNISKPLSDYVADNIYCKTCVPIVQKAVLKQKRHDDYMAKYYKDGLKLCKICNKYKDTTSFSSSKQTIDSLSCRCDDCSKINNKLIKNAASKFRSLKQSATKRNLVNNLDTTEFKEWFDTHNNCEYCNLSDNEYTKIVEHITNSNDIILKKYIAGSNNTKHLTIDRKNSSEGYTIDNIVKCCWFCNQTKGSLLSYNDMISIGKIVRLRTKEIFNI